MRLLEFLQSAAHDLVRHKLRSLLTMLGIIFGVGAVISMLSIGAGAQAEALQVIDSMGLRNIIVRDKPAEQDELYTRRERSLGLSLRDLEGIRAVTTDVTAGSGRKRVRVDRVLSANGRSEGQVLGVGREYFGLTNLRVAEGALFDGLEERTNQRLCVLGQRARKALFAFDPAVGQPVKVGDVWFHVAAVLESQNLTRDSFQGVELESSDNSVFVPITTALKMFDRPQLESELDELVLQTAASASIESTAILVDGVLSQLHGGEADFTLVVPEQLLDQSRRTRQIFNIVMGGIAGLSLLVGGIGIMNIMLASVLERTREIGVRRALGARRRDIRALFLCEAVVLSLLGGLLGVILGFAIAWGVSKLSEWNTVITGLSIVLSFGFSMAIGIIFGTYPAINAARLDPIEALRYE